MYDSDYNCHSYILSNPFLQNLAHSDTCPVRHTCHADTCQCRQGDTWSPPPPHSEHILCSTPAPRAACLGAENKAQVFSFSSLVFIDNFYLSPYLILEFSSVS